MTQADPGRPRAAEPARSRLSRQSLPALGLLPLRLFLGATYLYAGVDKLANAHFLASGDAFSVAAQMAGYARTSPLAPLINASMPFAVPIGLLIALAELAVGLGLLTGLAFRLAASAGAGLSLLFWLTASWSIAPYFFSPDLPYGFGFLTLALVGDAGLLVWKPFARLGATTGSGVGEGAAVSPVLDRRSLLAVGLLGALTLLAAAIATPLRLLGYGELASGGQTGGAKTTPNPATAPPATSAPTPADPTAAASAGVSAGPSAVPATATAVPATPTAPTVDGPIIGSLADFTSGNSLPFTVPDQVPFAMGPGGPGIMVRLGDGRVVAYTAICTHGRCTVGFDQAAMVIACPCHLATYDPANSAAVLSGPAPLPLPQIPLAVDPGGQIHVTATA